MIHLYTHFIALAIIYYISFGGHDINIHWLEDRN